MVASTERVSRTEWEILKKQRPKTVFFNAFGSVKTYELAEKRGISVVVSKKHEKTAVGRNLIKRRLYALYKKRPTNGIVVVFPSKQAYKSDFGAIKAFYEEFYRKITQ